MKKIYICICCILIFIFHIANVFAIDAATAIVIDKNSGRILFEKNAQKSSYIASTTKIMTAIVAIENGNLDDVVKISKRAQNMGGSTIKLKTSETLTLRELLYGLMLKSGNDAAIAIAEHVGGSVEHFVEMMNYKLEELGIKNTHFVTPHGLDTSGHFSTAYDLAYITKYAMGNKIFSEIVNTKNINISNREIFNTNEMLMIYPGATGVKTGYTCMAGRCLVASAKRNNFEIISVVLNCQTKRKRAESTKSILDQTFLNFKPYKLLEINDSVGIIPVRQGIKKSIEIVSCNQITLPLKEDELKNLKTKKILPKNLTAPISKDVEVGRVEFYLDDKILAASKIKTTENIRRTNFIDYLENIFKSWINV